MLQEVGMTGRLKRQNKTYKNKESKLLIFICRHIPISLVYLSNHDGFVPLLIS